MTLAHEVHSSELRSYRRCRQQWDWQHRENWEPIKKPAPLEDGTVWHKAMEVLYDPETWTSPLEDLHRAANAALIAEADKQLGEYLTRAGKNELDPEEAVDRVERVNTLRSMLVKLCRSLDRVQYRPIAVEREFSCPITYDDGDEILCVCDRCKKTVENAGGNWPLDVYGLPVTFNCRVDALFEDQEGFVFAVDHKSTSQLYKPDSVIPELDDQLPSYLWCLEQNHYLVAGLILNQFRKAYPKPPKRLERMREGRIYSVNKAQLTDLYVARQVFMRHDSVAYKHGLYNEYLEWLETSGPEFSRQFVVFKTPDQIKIIGENIRKQVLETKDYGPSIYPDPFRMNCEQCSFQLPCLAKQAGHDVRGDLEGNFVQTEPYYVVRRRRI